MTEADFNKHQSRWLWKFDELGEEFAPTVGDATYIVLENGSSVEGHLLDNKDAEEIVILLCTGQAASVRRSRVISVTFTPPVWDEEK